MSDIKELSRLTACTLFKIKAPRWNGNKGKIVGLDMSRLTKHNEIMFTYVRKSDGELSIPDHFYFDGDQVKQIDFEHQRIGNTTLVLVPLEHLSKLVRI